MSITSIQTTDIQRLTSGQVITDLVSVVKELVENSIDAGSSKIDVIYTNNGLSLIEVSDDGSGIEADDLQLLCLKHYTSKLKDFDHLATVATLGFRGEAMSSLCAISDVKVVSSTKESHPRASEADYDIMGQLLRTKTVVNGSQGTSVKVSRLFHNLPVRQKNLAKNIKREYHRSVNYLANYLLINTGIRFTVYNVNEKGRKSLLFGTKGGPKSTIVDSLISIYGSSGGYGLVPLALSVEDIEVKYKLGSSHGLGPTGRLNVKFNGYISNCSFGLGRSATDRQFVFVNKRPITLKKFLKTINEVYKTFNTNQYPVVVLNIEMDTKFLDINVTPDKRVVMMQNEDLLNDILREKLVEFFDGQSNVIPRNKNLEISVDGEHISVLSQPLAKSSQNGPRSQNRSTRLPATQQKEALNEDYSENETNKTPSNEDSADEIATTLYDERGTVSESMRRSSTPEMETETEDSILLQVQSELRDSTADNDHSTPKKLRVASQTTSPTLQENSRVEEKASGLFVDEEEEQTGSDVSLRLSPHASGGRNSVLDLLQYAHGEEEAPSTALEAKKRRLADSDILTIQIGHHPEEQRTAKRTKPASSEVSFEEARIGGLEENTDPRAQVHNISTTIATSMEAFGGENPKYLHRGAKKIPGKMQALRADNIEQKAEAETKLAFTVSKDDFLRMKVIGQFNLGFILVTLNLSDNVFIIDQHASDEKYNFERLCALHTTRSQALIAPQTMDLSPMDELVVMEHAATFERNGFKVRVDEDGAPGRRVALVALPQLRNVLFDTSDFHELVHKVGADARGVGAQCSKIRTLLALRACRGSIMIGQLLNSLRMATVVRNLGTLDKPWNCPHGRPTMRHLIELKLVPRFAADYAL